MSLPTPLDAAHAAMRDAPQDDLARLAFHRVLADSALVMLLDGAPEPGAAPAPRIFPTGEGRFVLAFDGEERLAAFAGGPADYAAMSGRQAVQALRRSGLGLGLNLGAPSETLLPPEAVDWLADLLDAAPQPAAEVPVEIRRPAPLPDAVLAALDAKLASAAGLAEAAALCTALFRDGSERHLLVFVGARHGAEPALAKAAGEALTFAGAEDVDLDVAFPGPGDALLDRLAGVALRFDLPVPAAPERPARTPPGSDPDRPPRLR